MAQGTPRRHQGAPGAASKLKNSIFIRFCFEKRRFLGPKRSQGGPREAPGRPQGDPRRPQEAPGRPQRAPGGSRRLKSLIFLCFSMENVDFRSPGGSLEPPPAVNKRPPSKVLIYL